MLPWSERLPARSSRCRKRKPSEPGEQGKPVRCKASLLERASPKPTGLFMLRFPYHLPAAETYGCDVGLSAADAASSFFAACLASSGPPATARADSYSALASEACPS